MATRPSRNSTRSHTSTTTHDLESQRQQQAAQQRTQQQMQIAADAASAMLRGAEIWTQLQLHAVQRTSQSWREAADKIRTAREPMELYAAQNQLMVNAFVQSLQLGQEFLQAAIAAQPDIARSTAEQPSMTETMAPMMQAWQTLLAPINGNGVAH